MTANLFGHLIKLPVEYFERRHMGDIVSRFGSIGQVQAILTHGMISVFVDGVLALLTLVAMLAYNKTLTAIVVVSLATFFAFRLAVYKTFRNLSEEEIIAAANESSHLMESVRASQTIKIFQKENDRKAAWQNKFIHKLNKQVQLSKWGIGFNTVSTVIFGLENVLVLFFAAHFVLDGALSLGMLYAFISYKGHFTGAANNLIARAIEFRMIELHLTRLADIALTSQEDSIGASEDGLSHIVDGKIEVRNISYRYSAYEPWVFKDVNFVINPGETVAITGPSGCGKTTLIKCLMGLIEPTEGQI